MLHPRIIPVLTLRNKGLIKTRQFGEDKYVGDPLNAVKIFNEKSVDELIFLDIDASAKQQQINYELIRKLAYESKMPLAYGGGVKRLDEALRVLGLGVEKVAVSSLLFENLREVEAMCNALGSQSVTAVLDIKKPEFLGGYSVYTHNGKKRIPQGLVEIIEDIQKAGVGEIVLNSIDRDGTMEGYDLELIQRVVGRIRVPLVVLGGAGNHAHLKGLFDNLGLVAAACGSLFVFNGKFRAVLINYPKPDEKLQIFSGYLAAEHQRLTLVN